MASRADHGHTTAAWTTVLIILAGIFLGAVAVVLLNWPLFYISLGIIVLGGVVGKVLQMAGLGRSRNEPVHDRNPDDVSDSNDSNDPVESSTP